MNQVDRLGKKAKKAAQIVRAFNNPVRLKVIQHIADNRGITVTELYRNLKLTQSVASQQLSVLKGAEIVTAERQGNCILYSINEKRVDAIESAIDQLLAK